MKKYINPILFIRHSVVIIGQIREAILHIEPGMLNNEGCSIEQCKASI